jgi:dephospho-CoA kinase
VKLFGPEIVNPETGDVDRRPTGRRVLGKPDILKQLIDIVWPEIQRMVELTIAYICQV